MQRIAAVGSKILTGLMLMAGLNACAPPPPGIAARPVAAGNTQAAAAPQTAAPGAGASTTTSPAVVALLDASARQEQDGQRAQAIASIERALRIAPADALLWNRLAKLNFAQGKWKQAANFAQKSIGFAGDDASLKENNWLLIAKARHEQGDVAGAQDARDQAIEVREGAR